MKILVIIPARKRKNIKGKNILKLGNKPLAQITIEFKK